MENEVWGFDDHLFIPNQNNATALKQKLTFDPTKEQWTLHGTFDIYKVPVDFPQPKEDFTLKYRATNDTDKI